MLRRRVTHLLRATGKRLHRRRHGDEDSEQEGALDKPNPKDGKATHLTPSEKASAKRSAKKAGRPYPNLVDNMHAASRGKKK